VNDRWWQLARKRLPCKLSVNRHKDSVLFSRTGERKEEVMAKGPAYTEDEDKLLGELAKKGGSAAALAKEFVTKFAARSEPAVMQKIRKLILARGEAKAAKKAAKAEAAGAPTSLTEEPAKRRGRPPKVNTAPLSDVPPAMAAPKRRGRPPRAAVVVPIVQNDNGGHVNGDGHEITVDLQGLRLVGSKKRVVEALQQLG
jgi:hypothetical protein